MALDRKEIELIFKGIDQTGAATDAALGNLQKFSGGMQKAAEPFANFTKEAAKVETALLATSVAIVAFSIKAAGDFDSAFREITTLIDEPIDSLGDFRQAILDYSTTSTASLSDITAAVYSAISAGVDYTDSLTVVNKAEQLAIAGKSTLKEALLALEGPLNAYGASAEEAGDYADVLFAAVKTGITTIPELSHSLAMAVPVASGAGVSFSELAGTVSALTANGMQTNTAVTAMTGILTGIIKPTNQAEEAAERLGIEFGVGAMQSMGFTNYLQYLGDAIDGNIDVAAELFGNIRGLAGVMSLAGEGSESLTRAMEEQANRAGAVAEAFDKMRDSIGFSTQTVINALQGIAIEIGTPLLSAYNSLADALAEVFRAIGANVKDGKLGGLVEYIESVMGDIEGILRRLAVNLPAALEMVELDGFQRNVDGVRDGIRKLLGGLDLDSPEGLARLIQILNNAVGQLGEFVGGAIGSFETFFTTIVNAAESVGNAAESFNKLAGAFGGMAIQLGIIMPALDTVLLALIAAKGGGIAAAATTAATTVGALATALGPTALVAAAGAAGLGIGTLLDKTFGLSEKLADGAWAIREWVTDAKGIEASAELAARQQLALARETAEATKALEEMARKDAEFDRLWDVVMAGGQAFDTIEEALNNAVDTQRVFFDESTGKWLVMGDAVRQFGGEFSDIEDSYDLLQKRLERLGETVEENGKTWVHAQDEAGRFFLKLVDDTETASEKTGEWIRTTVDGVETFTRAGDAASTAFDESKQSAIDAVKASESYLIAMEQIASNERIKNIEARVSINVAQIEADTRRVESAFESINTTISSTGDVLQSLYGAFTSADSSWDQRKIERWINEENKRRDAALAMQKDLVQAEIDLLRARERSLNRGDAQITITGDGLQPHLEGFMWEIIRRVQMRVNQDGLEMLLGAT